MTTHAALIAAVRNLTESSLLAGAYGEGHQQRQRAILAEIKAAGLKLPSKPDDAMALALAINAELNAEQAWSEHPALLAVLDQLPKVIERTRNPLLLAKYMQAAGDETDSGDRGLPWITLTGEKRRELVSRLIG